MRRAISLHNDEANTDLFNAFFEKPGFREAFIALLAQACPEIRAEYVV